MRFPESLTSDVGKLYFIVGNDKKNTTTFGVECKLKPIFYAVMQEKFFSTVR